MQGWVGPTVAISLVLIAIAFLAIAAAVIMVGRKVTKESGSLTREIHEFRHELGPTIQALGRLSQTSEQLSEKVKEELDAVLLTSKRVRRGVSRGMRRARGRLEELDALYEVVHDEVQETALQVAATLRSVRSGAGALTRIKRLLRRVRR